MTEYRSGFVAVIGRPNVGKSTMLNNLLQQKISIVSNKPQTTRNTIQAVLTGENSQIVFLDTPGLHQPLHKLGEYMVKTARSAWADVDVICFLVDITSFRAADEKLIEELVELDTPVFIVANKSDLVSEEVKQEFCHQIELKYNVAAVLAISALDGDGLEDFVAKLVAQLPPGPQYYPDDWITDHPERFIMAEFIREQILHHTEEEIPHSVAVDIEEVESSPDKDLVSVRATIYVERNSQKGIVIGKQGSMLKQIGSKARVQIEGLLGSKVYLELWVKVKKDWRNKSGSLREFGYN